jgi:hypothetical protein
MKKSEQQTQLQQGGDAMSKPQQQKSIIFVTFPSRIDSQEARAIVNELRKRYDGIFVFSPRPPRGRKQVITIGEQTVIVTFPYTPKNEQEAPQSPEGFTLGELIKNKKT